MGKETVGFRYCVNSLRILSRKKNPLNKTKGLTKSMNMNIWVVGTSNQLFIRGSYTKTKFSKIKFVTGKTPFFVIRILYSPFHLS